jgi:hypothetical protein
MGRYGKSLRAVVTEITKSSERSPLFWWLVEHHDELVAASRGRRMQWDALCIRFAESGLTDSTGKPPTAATARRTWHRARHMVAEGRQLQATEATKPKRVGATPPSRISRDWRPESFMSQTAQLSPARSPDQVREPSQASLLPAPVPAAEARALSPISLNKPAPLPEWARHLGETEPEEENDDALLPPDLPPEFPEEARANLIRIAKESRADDRKKFGLPPKRRMT